MEHSISSMKSMTDAYTNINTIRSKVDKQSKLLKSVLVILFIIFLGGGLGGSMIGYHFVLDNHRFEFVNKQVDILVHRTEFLLENQKNLMTEIHDLHSGGRVNDSCKN